MAVGSRPSARAGGPADSVLLALQQDLRVDFSETHIHKAATGESGKTDCPFSSLKARPIMRTTISARFPDRRY